MALIYFYDSTPLDEEQLSNGLKDSDHDWRFVREQIKIDNIDPEAEVISVFVSSKVTEKMLERMPKLRLIACRSTGFNNIPLESADRRGITVVNVPTYGENTVAEYAIGLLLALSRKIIKSAQHPDSDSVELMGFDLFGKTLGVIGTGRIGQNVIKIAKGFSMNVIAYDAFPKPEIQKELGFNYVGLDELVEKSDAITLHAPYLPTTYHLISRERISHMKKSAIIVNTARGELIDTRALAEALAEGEIAGAALDVVEGENLLHLDEEILLLHKDQPDREALQHSMELMALKRIPNVIITPHNAFNTDGAIGRINATTAQNILDYWYDKIPNKVEAPKMSSGRLILVRHAESEWNASGKWTGLRDVHLSEKGFHEAALLGLEMTDINVDQAFCSDQIRTLETLEGLLASARKIEVPIQRSGSLNERDYGDYTGMNKWEMREAVGEDAFNGIRRGWDYPVPNGETLKDVYNRVVPYYKETILPLLKDGKNILVVSHGNSLRALVKYLEQISDGAVGDLEMIFGTIVMYRVDDDGYSTHKELRHINSVPPNA